MSPRRVLGRAAAILVTCVCALWPVMIAAQTTGADRAADLALGLVSGHTRIDGGGRADLVMVQRAWSAGGVSVAVTSSALHGLDADPSAAASRLFVALCGQASLGRQVEAANQPERGDLVRFLPASGDPGYRLGIFTDQAHVAVVDTWDPSPDGGHLITRVQRDLVLQGDWNHQPGDPPVSRDPVAVFCHVNASLLSGVAATVAPAAPGRVQIVDGGLAAENIDWAVRHPVVTQSPFTSLAGIVGSGLGLVIGLVGWVAGQVGSVLAVGGNLVDGLVGRLGWSALLVPGLITAAAMFRVGDRLRSVLVTSFDGSGLHRVLTVAVVLPLVLLLAPMLAPLAAVAVAGRVTGWWSSGSLPALLLAAASNIAGFTVTTLTGVDDGPTRVVEVVLAVVGDVFIVARPLAVVRAADIIATRLGGPAAGLLWSARVERVLGAPLALRTAGGVHSGLEVAQEGGSLVSGIADLRPTSWINLRAHVAEISARLRISGGVLRGGSGVETAALTRAPLVTARSLARAGSGEILDVASWLSYRPSAVLSDLVSECGRLSTFLSGGLASVDTDSHVIFRAMDRLLAHLNPLERQEFLDVTLPRLRLPAELANRHSGATVIGNLAAGVPPRPRLTGTPGQPQPPAPPWTPMRPPGDVPGT